MDFRATHVLVTSGQDNQHRLFFCANRRTVKSEALTNKVANLLPSFKDDVDGRSAVYAGYISGGFLDETVNSERTNFSVPEQLEMDFPSDLSWQELLQAAVEDADRFLSPYTSPIKKSKEEQIDEFVRYEAPQYRALVKHKREWLDQIPPNLPKEKLDLELYRIDRRYGEELKEQSHKLLESVKAEEQREYDEYREVFANFIEEWNERGMSQLAQYVTHRRTTLAFLDKRLQVRDDGKYPLEDSVHKLIFPLRETSDDVRPEKMNLWIINETLAYHYYLASDKKFKQIEPIDVSSQNRPDLLIFNKPFAFADCSPTFGSIVLVEFKRPAREDYDDEENPIAQVYGYVREIKEGAAKDRHGRPISVPEHTPFYAYIICDINPRLRTQAENFQLTKTPDTLGYFGFNPNLGVYVEIMSFDKLVGDAKKRNAILFEKLGLGL
jgi:hypothetical protein